MHPLRVVVGLSLGVLLAACGSSAGTTHASALSGIGSVDVPTPVAPQASGIVLRQAPPDMGCDAIGWDGEPYRTLTFHVDPTAAEHVWAASDTGGRLTTYWSRGFQPGTPAERLVRDPLGEVFVTDGLVVDVPQAANLRIHDYLVCLQPNTLWVLPTEHG
jgi:hypothetical protein